MHAAAGQQQAVFTSAKFVPAGQKYGDDAAARLMTTHGPQLKTARQASDGREVSPAGRRLSGRIRWFTSCFHAGIVLLIVRSFWNLAATE